jgi:excisionase family DNA binding protein
MPDLEFGTESESSFIREVNLLYEQESARLNATSLNVDVLFASFLRYMSRFGFFQYGPLTIDVSLVEAIVEHTTAKRRPGDDGAISIGDDVLRFSHLVMEEVRRSGRRRIDELHYLLAFMRIGEGLPARVFGELGVTAEEVEEYTRTGASSPATMERLYSPEQAAEYLNVHVQTVRAWIRSGRLKARRLAGQRSLRIRQSDLQSVLEPLDMQDLDPTSPSEDP